MRELTEAEYEILETKGSLTLIDDGKKYFIEKINDTIHYAKAYVFETNGIQRYEKFVCAPKNLGERKNISLDAVLLFYGMPSAFCFFCGTYTPNLHETFELDHIKELKDATEWIKFPTCKFYAHAVINSKTGLELM